MDLSLFYVIFAIVVALAVAGYTMYKFYHLPSSTQLAKVKEWLIFACMEAEKELGSGTGQLKLRMVYDMFLTKFSWLSKYITFEKFSGLVDDSLTKFKNMLGSNDSVKKLVEE